MKKSILITLSVLFLMASCKKDEKLEITMKQSGSLSVTVKDASGNPIVDEPVYLYDYSSLMDSKKTDANGNVSFGTLLIGNYNVVLKDVEIGSRVYSVNQVVPVTIGNAVNLSLVPEEFVGSIEFYAREQVYNPETGMNEYVPLAGVSAYAITSEDFYDNSFDIDELINLSITNGTTSTNGTVLLQNIPANQSIMIFYYFDDITNWDYEGSYYVAKYEEERVSVIIW